MNRQVHVLVNLQKTTELMCRYCAWCINLFKKNTWTTLVEVNHVLFSETVSRRCFIKKLFLKISQNSQENNRAGVSFLIKLKPANLLKKRLRHRCFPMNFVKFFKTALFIDFHIKTSHLICTANKMIGF